MVRQCHKNSAADHISYGSQQDAVAILSNSNSAIYQTYAKNTHIGDAVLKSANHKYKNTPENHDQFSRFTFQLRAAPHCQTYQNIT